MLLFAIVAPPLGLGNPVPNFEGKHTTCPSPTRHESIVVVTEALLEHAYLQSFVAFYSRLGVECFLIFHDDDLGASLPRLASSVVLLRSNNTGSQRLEDYLHPVQRSGFKWVLAIAVNEFLLLAPRFQGSLQHYIADAQIAAANGIDAFQFSWALTEILEPVCWQLPVSDVLSRKRLQFYSDVHVKTMSRISQVIRFRFHYSPVLRMKPEVCKRHQQGCANGKQRPRRSVHVAGMQFRPSREEGDWIKRGILLSPYVPTDATDARKYADAALVHVSSPSKSSLSVSEVCVVIGHTAVGVGDLLALTSHSFYTSDLPVLTRRSY